MANHFIFGTLCLFCESGAPDLSQCNKVGQCTGNQVCITEKYLEDGGTFRWYSGCQDREVCKRLGALNKRSLPEGNQSQNRKEVAHFGVRVRSLVRPGQNVCSGCCDDADFCNVKECGFNADFLQAGFKTCFACDDVDTPTACDHVIQCNDQQSCFTKRFHQGGTAIAYKMGCEETKMCDAYTGFIQYFTKRRAVSSSLLTDLALHDEPQHSSRPVGISEDDLVSSAMLQNEKSKRSIDDPKALCLTCCNDDFCNRLQDCGAVSTFTSISPQSTSATFTNVTPILTNVTPKLTNTTLTSTSARITSTSATPTPTSVTPTLTSVTPTPTSVTSTPTSVTSTPTSVTPTSTSSVPTSTSVTPIPTSSVPTSTSVTPTSANVMPTISQQIFSSQRPTISPSQTLLYPSEGFFTITSLIPSSSSFIAPSSSFTSSHSLSSASPSSMYPSSPPSSLSSLSSSILSSGAMVSSSAALLLTQLPIYPTSTTSMMSSMTPVIFPNLLSSPSLFSSSSPLISATLSSSYSIAGPSVSVSPPPNFVTSQIMAVVSGTKRNTSTSVSNSLQFTTPSSVRLIEGVWCYNCSDALCGYGNHQTAVKCNYATPFCLNTYVVDNGVPAITKSCVDFARCKSKWYVTSSDNSNCDSLSVQPGQRKECNFCCVTDYCNKPTVPKTDTLFDPSFFPGLA